MTKDSAEEDDCAEEHEVLYGSELTHSEARQLLLKLRNYAIENNGDILGDVQNLINMVETIIVKAKFDKKQSTLDSFFTTSTLAVQ